MQMKLKDLSTKPQLVRIALNDEATLQEFGEELEFWVYDKQPLTKYVKFMRGEQTDAAELVDFCSEMILDELGQPILTEGRVLPTRLMVKAINEVVKKLGE